jgi:hypothetical protein
MSNLLNASVKGVFLIAATPFTESGELDLTSTDRMVDFYLVQHPVNRFNNCLAVNKAPGA